MNKVVFKYLNDYFPLLSIFKLFRPDNLKILKNKLHNESKISIAFLFISVPIDISYRLSGHTLLFLAIVSFIVNSSWKLLLIIYLAYWLDKRIDSLSEELYTVIQLFKIRRYHDLLISKGYEIHTSSVSDFINDKKLCEKINEQANQYTSNGIDIGKIAIIKNRNSNVLIDSFKAFPTGMLFSNENTKVDGVVQNRTIICSTIFINQDYENMSDIRRFMFFHELGHLNTASYLFEIKLYRAIISLFLYSLIIVGLSDVNLIYFVVFILPYILYKAYYYTSNRCLNKVEMTSDIFSLSLFPEKLRHKLMPYIEILYSKERYKDITDTYNLVEKYSVDKRGYGDHSIVDVDYTLIKIFFVLSLISYGIYTGWSVSILSLIIINTFLLLVSISLMIYGSIIVITKIPNEYITRSLKDMPPT